jgi:pimeloyl-ACP methyl ester carboxylesterase
MNKYANVNGINLHYLERDGNSPPLVLLPGLTANAHSFDGVVAAGLSPRFRTIAVDFRGRGRSDKPESGYSMADYSADIVALIDYLALENVVIVGHSFGALIGLILAAQHPARIEKLVIIDSSPYLITERTVKLVKASLDRLGKRLPSMDVYLNAMRQMPYLNGHWDDALESYFSSDVKEFEDGSVQAWALPQAISETIEHEYVEPWDDHMCAVAQPTLLINALEPYGSAETPPILPEDMAEQTVAAIPGCKYVRVPGNHITMLFGENAPHVVNGITVFVGDE